MYMRVCVDFSAVCLYVFNALLASSKSASGKSLNTHTVYTPYTHGEKAKKGPF